jgi:hypothetical protein
MNETEGLLIVFGVVVLFLSAVVLWKKIPAYQCQRCFSYDIEINTEGFAACQDCGLVWDPDAQ